MFFNKLSINKLLIIDANDFYETDDILLSNNNTYIDLSAKIIKPFKINTYLSLDNNNIINAKINLQHNINKFKLNLKSNIKIKKNKDILILYSENNINNELSFKTDIYYDSLIKHTKLFITELNTNLDFLQDNFKDYIDTPIKLNKALISLDATTSFDNNISLPISIKSFKNSYIKLSINNLNVAYQDLTLNNLNSLLNINLVDNLIVATGELNSASNLKTNFKLNYKLDNNLSIKFQNIKANTAFLNSLLKQVINNNININTGTLNAKADINFNKNLKEKLNIEFKSAIDELDLDYKNHKIKNINADFDGKYKNNLLKVDFDLTIDNLKTIININKIKSKFSINSNFNDSFLKINNLNLNNSDGLISIKNFEFDSKTNSSNTTKILINDINLTKLFKDFNLDEDVYVSGNVDGLFIVDIKDSNLSIKSGSYIKTNNIGKIKYKANIEQLDFLYDFSYDSIYAEIIYMLDLLKLKLKIKGKSINKSTNYDGNLNINYQIPNNLDKVFKYWK